MSKFLRFRNLQERGIVEQPNDAGALDCRARLSTRPLARPEFKSLDDRRGQRMAAVSPDRAQRRRGGVMGHKNGKGPAPEATGNEAQKVVELRKPTTSKTEQKSAASEVMA